MGDVVNGMASSAPPEPITGVPAAETAAIRSALNPTLHADFDCEWMIVLDRAKDGKEMSGVLELLIKWRHIAATDTMGARSIISIAGRGRADSAGGYQSGRGFHRRYAGTGRPVAGELRLSGTSRIEKNSVSRQLSDPLWDDNLFFQDRRQRGWLE